MKRYDQFIIKGTALLGLSFVCATPIFAAKPIDLQNKSASSLQSVISPLLTAGKAQVNLKQVSASVDSHQMTHIRMQQMYEGHPVFGADVTAHVPQGGSTSLMGLTANKNVSMNGTVYQGLSQDLVNTPAYVFSSAQADKATQQAIQTYQKKSGIKTNASETKTDLIVYVDDQNKAHWAYLVKFAVNPAKQMPAKPAYIIDATTMIIYQEWNEVLTLDVTTGGGFGGNQKMGELVYDGMGSDLPSLAVERDALNKMCYLENDLVTVRDRRHNDDIVQFNCAATESGHGSIYWDADQDAVNGAFSPSNDALYAGKVINELYQNWCGVPALVESGKPMMMNMRVHEDMENAYWDGKEMTFGDGGSRFYPLVSLGVAAHEISHGFTQQHANLFPFPNSQQGGLNESFSDIAAQAAEYYSSGEKTNSWQIGPEIVKEEGHALRYMDRPTRDCYGRNPGDRCSISDMEDFKPHSIDVHFLAGVFNRFFYLFATSPGWNTKTAFQVVAKANRDGYWNSLTKFEGAACGVVKAARDDGHKDVSAIVRAADGVGLNVRNC